MLKIIIPKQEHYDESLNLFIEKPSIEITLEHSLVSLSKWEEYWEQPFLSTNNLSEKQLIHYIKCMTITKNIPDSVLYTLPVNSIQQITEYIKRPMTATTFPSNKTSGVKQKITAELIYYWMITLNIPFECQKWHLNKLFALIKLCSIKNAPSKKKNQRELLEHNKMLNDARRQQLNTTG